ncbi:MAG: 4Fe-4S dicluster domain-containing protein [Acidobacteria bacterium]|nr:4Fe-4S dicluster domain-containing protein [Acidobacteriota bacterium]
MATTTAPVGRPAFHGVDTPPRELLDTCVHCGFCLPTCPTYVLWGEEMDSPRGRVYLMRSALDGRATLSNTMVGHFDACLGCLSCVTACPSGVQYGPLIERTRAQIERHYERGTADRLFRGALFRTLPYPGVMRLLLAPLVVAGGLVRAIGQIRWLPARVSAILRLAPSVTWSGITGAIPERTAAAGSPRLTVGLLTGCVQRVVFPQVHRATLDVLSAEGCTVLAPAGQGCCGALSRHAGRLEEARAFARRTIETFEQAGVDRIVVNAAGCGSSMKEYGELFEGDATWTVRARAFAAKVRDVSELVGELGPPRAARHPIAARVAYHDACHLAHAQGIRAEPRDLLRSIPGIELLELPEPEICCGSAGIYNLVQPRAAEDLGRRKGQQIQTLAPDAVATANPGCTMQIGGACASLGAKVPVLHPIEILAASIRGDRLDASSPGGVARVP